MVATSMFRSMPRVLGVLSALVLLGFVAAACAPAAPANPTAAPAAPTTAAAPARPVATTAPAKPTSVPAAKPAQKAEAKPTPQPAAKSVEKPATKPAAKAAADAKAVEDFYRGKTLRIVVGYAPGGGFDVWARAIAKYIGTYVPGKPNVIVENKPGAGSMLAANAVYKTEPKDGTVVATFNSQMVLQQALGQEGMEFDLRKYQWLGSASSGANACMIHKDAGITDIQQVMGPNGKEVTMGGEAPGSGISDTPAVMNAALGTKFRIIYGYQGASKIKLAVENREVDGYCLTWDSIVATLKDWFEPEQQVTVPIIMGDKTPQHPWLKDSKIVAAEQIAPNEQARKLLRAVQGPRAITQPYTVAPEVPAERVAALRQAFAATFQDRKFQAEIDKIGFLRDPKTGAQVSQIVEELLSLDPAMVEAVKKALQPQQ